MNKFDFYKSLAETASCAVEHDPDIGARELCRRVVGKVQEMYQEKEYNEKE